MNKNRMARCSVNQYPIPATHATRKGAGQGIGPSIWLCFQMPFPLVPLPLVAWLGQVDDVSVNSAFEMQNAA